MTGTAVYVYAVTDATRGGDLGAVRGVAGAPVRAITGGGLAAVVSTVDAGEFGEEALRRNLEDLTWLEQAARAHHGVVDAVAGAGPTAPLRLATIYLSDDNGRAGPRRSSSPVRPGPGGRAVRSNLRAGPWLCDCPGIPSGRRPDVTQSMGVAHPAGGDR